jgi:hypothetical protein
MSDCDHAANPDSCWWERDVRGIPLCKVCDQCVKEKLSTYSPSVLSEEQQVTAFGKVVADSDYSACAGEQVEADY